MSAHVPVMLRRQIRVRFAERCAYCRTPEALTASTFEVEHIIPRTAGGRTEAENLCLACPSCNRHKAHRQSAFDPVTDRVVPLFNPNLQTWMDHFAWSEDGMRIDALTPTGRVTIETLRINRPQLMRIRRMWRIMGEHPDTFEAPHPPDDERP